MKKIALTALVLSIVTYYSCSKKEKADIPVACFTVTALDSSRVATLTQVTIDSIIRTNAPGYFVDVPEGTSFKAYKRRLIFRYCGSTSKFKALYTGDPSHIYVDPANPDTVKTAQAGVDLTTDYFVYTYAAAGAYPVTQVTTSVSSTGKDVKRAVATKKIILQ